jgi:hypothetical protein
LPVAQNAQDKLHPACDEMHAVIRLLVGINTPSMICPSMVLNPHLIVLSELF